MSLPTNSFLVGTLNLLGDAYNPFEFLPRGGNDAAAARMISNYQTIEKKALELTFHDFKGLYDDIRGLPDVGCAEECEKLVSQLAVHSANNDGRIWGFFQGDILRNDNKIISKRLNLICLATLPVDNALLGDICSPDLHQQSHIMRRTVTEARATVVAAFGALFTAYSRDYCLLLWDLVCCAAALASKEAYVLICSESVLNPENMPAIAQHFVSRISSLASSEILPIIALQEWPSDGSARRECYREAFAQRSCSVLAGSDSVAIAYDTSLSCEDLTPTLQVADIIAEVVNGVQGVDEEDAAAFATDVKSLKATTARKVLAARFGGVSGLTVLVVHAKEPRTLAGARVLARLILALGSMLPAPWVAMSDTNIATQTAADAFCSEVSSTGCQVVPEADVKTTAKYRSLLHGQTYKANKSHVVVEAPKDKLLCSSRASLTKVQVFPRIQDGETLPRSDWASDHCLVSALFTPPPD